MTQLRNSRNTPGKPAQWLYALGDNHPPLRITVREHTYSYVRTFKHDFFAATALYHGDHGGVVLKSGRAAPFACIPLNWIGRALAFHEARLFQCTHDLDGIPQCLGRYGVSAIVHAFVPGRPLQKTDVPDDHFFPRLRDLLDAMHRRNVAYVDLEKPENILRGDDGNPWLIDFQIAWHIPDNRGGNTWLNRVILDMLQAADRYHLLKHWRRLRPDQVAALGLEHEFRPPPWIRWHRAIFRPLIQFRRRVLVWLGARDTPHGRSPG